MKKINPIAFLPFLVFVAIGAMFVYGMWGKRVDKNISPLIGKPLPTITSFTIDNKEYAIKADGKPKIINFFASWCVPCRAEHKQLLQMSAEQGFDLIGVAYEDKPQNIANYLDELGNPYHTVLIDLHGAAGSTLGLSGVPETYVVGSDGIIKYKHKGEITPADAPKLIGMAK